METYYVVEVNGRQSVHKGYKWFYKHDYIQKELVV